MVGITDHVMKQTSVLFLQDTVNVRFTEVIWFYNNSSYVIGYSSQFLFLTVVIA